MKIRSETYRVICFLYHTHNWHVLQGRFPENRKLLCRGTTLFRFPYYVVKEISLHFSAVQGREASLPFSAFSAAGEGFEIS